MPDPAAPTRWPPPLPCAECHRPLMFDDANGTVACVTSWCSAAGMDRSLWQAIHELGTADPNPAGWPRPKHHGLPIPWVTVTYAGHVSFRHLHGARLRRCQTDWLCQVCGLQLPPQAWVVTTPDTTVITPAGMHQHCRDLAAASCPHLQHTTTLRTMQVDQTKNLSAGRPLPDVPNPPWWQPWTITPDGALDTL